MSENARKCGIQIHFTLMGDDRGIGIVLSRFQNRVVLSGSRW